MISKIVNYIKFGLPVFLPNTLKVIYYRKMFGWDISDNVKIGFSYIKASNVILSCGAKIGHFNVIKNLENFEIGENSKIGHFNKFNALEIRSNIHFEDEKNRTQSFIIGKECGITKSHYFDCNNLIKIGNFTIIAGHGCSFFTHSINIEKNRQETAPIYIGNYCMVGACSIITRGATLPDCSVLAANSTLHKAFEKTHTLYSGVPAMPLKDLNPESKYFHRDIGFVG